MTPGDVAGPRLPRAAAVVDTPAETASLRLQHHETGLGPGVAFWTPPLFSFFQMFRNRPQHSKSTDRGNNSKPAHLVRPRLVLWNLCAKIARVLLRTLERRLFQQRPLEKLSSFRLLCKSSLITSDAASCVSFTRSNSMLRLSAASGTSAVTGITCFAVSLTYLAASLTDTLHVPELSSISLSCSQRQSDVSHRLTLGVLIA